MDFIEALRQFAHVISERKEQILTEEATKTALIMPFFSNVLGYDVFNPKEFVPEFVADIGIKKGEKVDYAIMIEGKPLILVEAKYCGEPLDKHAAQLFRYFSTTDAVFGILTNGIIYRFYTDLEKKNTMDMDPFLEIDLLNLRDNLIPELKKFCKSNFDADGITSAASNLKYSNRIKSYFASQLENPDDDFIRFFITPVYGSMKTQSIIEKFRPIVRRTINEYITELMNDRISDALKSDSEKAPTQIVETTSEIEQSVIEQKSRINTTQEEIEAYYIIKAVLVDYISIDRITYKDNINYFSVLVDGRPSRWICRLMFDRNKKFIVLPADSKQDKRYDIDSLSDLYKLKNEFKESLDRYIRESK